MIFKEIHEFPRNFNNFLENPRMFKKSLEQSPEQSQNKGKKGCFSNAIQWLPIPTNTKPAAASAQVYFDCLVRSLFERAMPSVASFRRESNAARAGNNGLESSLVRATRKNRQCSLTCENFSCGAHVPPEPWKPTGPTREPPGPPKRYFSLKHKKR